MAMGCGPIDQATDQIDRDLGPDTYTFTVSIDLSSFGIPDDATVGRVRLHIFDVGLGTKSGDVSALGALNSGAPVPEPSTGLLVGCGVLLLASWRSHHTRKFR